MQDIQDFKRMTISQPRFEINGNSILLEGENVSIYPIDSKKDANLTIKCTEDHEKIKQNQKIVNRILQMYGDKDDKTHFMSAAQKEAYRAEQYTLKHIVHTAIGKDIKEL